jgi:hypothetical protein
MLRALFLVAALLSPADLPKELEGLEAEGAKWFNEAGKTDLSTSERNEARKKAWINLYKAKEILDAHWEAHPEDQDRLEDRMVKVGQMCFWIKKESPIGLLEGTGVGPKAGTNVKRDWPDKDKAPPVKEGETPAPAPTPEAAPPKPAARTFDEEYAEAEAWAKKHRADLSGIMERFQALLANFPDQTAHPLYAKAVEKAGAGSSKLKDAYRKMRNDDPDSLKGGAPDNTKLVLIGLTRDLGNNDAGVRERAAKLLGTLGSGEAAFSIADRMKREKEAAPLHAMGAALVAIGGRKTVEQLHKFRDDELAPRAFEWLVAISGRNPVDRRLAVEEMGEFALAKDEAVAGKAVDHLVSLGNEGAHGLLKAIKTPSTEIRLKIIPALAATKNPRVATQLTSFLLLGDVDGTVRCREAAKKAIMDIGEPAVPYLFAGLRNAGTKMHTGDLLRKLTGQMFSSSRPGDWQRWWKSTHPDWKEEPEEKE